MNEKTSGYALLIAGAGVMIFAVMSVLLVFTKNIKPVQLFAPAPVVSQPKSNIELPPGAPPDVAALMSQLTSQSGGLFSAETMNQYANISAHFFLMGFVMTFGFKLATLGVQLIRPVYVKYNVKENPFDKDKSTIVP